MFIIFREKQIHRDIRIGFMSLEVKSIKVDNFNRFEFILDNNDPVVASIFRAAMYNEVPNYSIDIVIYDLYICGFDKVFLANILGNLILKQDLDYGDLEKEYRFELSNNTDSPKKIYSRDINGLQCIKDFHIFNMYPGEKIIGRYKIGVGIGENHGKWCPVSNVSFSEIDNGYYFKGKLTGVLPLEKVITLAREGFQKAKERTPPTIFHKRNDVQI